MTENNQEKPEATEAAAEAPAPAAEPANAEVTVESSPSSSRGVTNDGKSIIYWGLGRRKAAVARVRLKAGGSGKIIINKKPFNEYFVREQDRRDAIAPLNLTKALERFDIFVNVKGGGMTGQAGATRLGVARAIANYDEKLVDMMRKAGYMTRDARVVERKKYGQKGARASYQFSKR